MSPKILLQDHEGKTWVTNMTWQDLLAKIDHLEQTVNKLWDEHYKVTERLSDVEKPIRRHKIFELLKAESVPRTWGWINRRINCFFSDLNDLIGNQKIIPVKHGYKTLYIINKKRRLC